METVPGGRGSLEAVLMWLGVAAGDLAAVSALRPYLKRRTVAADPHGHAPLLEDLAEHPPDGAVFPLLCDQAPGAFGVSKADVLVRVVPAAPGSGQVSAAPVTRVTAADGLAATAPSVPHLAGSGVSIRVLPVVPRPPALSAIVFIVVLVKISLLFFDSRLTGDAAARRKAATASLVMVVKR